MTRPLVLLVEDEPDTIDLTLRAFERGAVASEIVVARDGVEAIEWLVSTEVAPRLVLLDMHMPRVGGLEVLRRLRAHPKTRWCPVVMLTSSTSERDRLESYALGANSYLCKPVRFERLVEMVRLLGSYWLDLNEPPPEVA